MENVKKKLSRILRSYRQLPDKKQYIEFFTALLSIPVMLTVILINFNNLNLKKNTTPPATPTEQSKTIIVSLPPGSTQTSEKTTNALNVSPTQETPQQCNKQLAPVTITSPQENETVTDNPVSVVISYDQQNYCAVVWSYRVNGGTWSDYGNDSISLYNLTEGEVKLDVKVKSIVTGDETTLTRNFIYRGTTTVTPTPAVSTPTPASSSASSH